jgi:LEA14-like dessication related protein
MMANQKAKRPKVWLWIVGLLIITIAAVLLWQRNILLNYGKKGGSKPHLSVKKLFIHDVGDSRIYMTARVMVSNPLLIALDADKLEYELLVDSVKILETELTKPIRIKPLDSMLLDVPIELLRDRFEQVLDRFNRHDSDSADYTLKAKLHLKVPIAGNKTYTVNQTQRAPAFRLLKLNTEDVDIEKFGLKNSEISMTLIVENPNRMDISVRDIAYELTIGKDLRLEGELPDVTNIPARATIKLPLKIDAHTRSITRLAWQVLFEKKHTPFHIDFKCHMVSTDDTFKNLRIAASRDGKLDELKKNKEKND